MVATLTAFVISLLFACFVGSYTDYILGIIAFCMSFFPALKVSIALDLGAGLYNNHHKRNDNRAKKSIESLMMIEEQRHENTVREIILDNYLKSRKRP